MVELQRLADWLAYVDRIRADVRMWWDASGRPYSNEAALREAEASIGRAVIEVVTDRTAK